LTTTDRSSLVARLRIVCSDGKQQVAFQEFIKEIEAATQRLPKDSWITRGDWGAYEAWGVGSDGSRRNESIFTPHKNMIDDLTADHPVLINRYDRTEGLANSLALKELGIDDEDGVLDGEIFREALSQIPEKSFERRLAETRRALEECSKYGVTTVQDMSPLVIRPFRFCWI